MGIIVYIRPIFFYRYPDPSTNSKLRCAQQIWKHLYPLHILRQRLRSYHPPKMIDTSVNPQRSTPNHKHQQKDTKPKPLLSSPPRRIIIIPLLRNLITHIPRLPLRSEKRHIRQIHIAKTCRRLRIVRRRPIERVEKASRFVPTIVVG